MILTDHGEVVADASRLRVPEIHAAPVHALVVTFHVLDDELSGFRHRAEVGSGAEDFRRRPVARLRHRLASHIETEREKHIVLFQSIYINQEDIE